MTTRSMRTIVHVAPISLAETTGMGRVAWHWREAFVAAGYRFIHIGLEEVGPLPHQSLFAAAARRVLERHHPAPAMVLVHEPAGAAFIGAGRPLAVFSHGVERREWELRRARKEHLSLSLRTRLLYPLWRLRPCDVALRSADAVLAVNSEDRDFILRRYGRDPGSVLVFRNGVRKSGLTEACQAPGPLTALFIGTWIQRKGITLLVESGVRLASAGIPFRWMLAGTGKSDAEVRRDWPEALQSSIEVISHFGTQREAEILARAHVLVLPSFFEGQPLALLQAMEAGRCCVTSGTCGQLDLIRHGENGLLHEPGDVEGLVRALQLCARDPALRVRLGARARADVAGRGWSAVSEEVVHWLEGRMQFSPSCVEA